MTTDTVDRITEPTDKEIVDGLMDAADAVNIVGGGNEPEDRRSKYEAILPALPVDRNGILLPEFRRYYLTPWTPIFYDFHDPYNDLTMITHGPRGGGKTITAVGISIIDGQMKGIPVISNVEFSWVAKDNKGRLYKIVSLPFDRDKFVHGDESLRYKRLLLDEANYSADRLRSTSNLNLSTVDILQQSRKFRMTVLFCTINYMWVDPRVTGSLLDVLIECNDIYYKPYGKKHGVKKGHRIAWDVVDQSGKLSGIQFNNLGGVTFNARALWHTYDTLSFVDPTKARQKLKMHQKMMYDENGFEVLESQWITGIMNKLRQLANVQDEWNNNDMFETLGIGNDLGLRQRVGRLLRREGVNKTFSNSKGECTYNLAELVV